MTVSIPSRKEFMLVPRDVECPSSAPTCNCKADQQCVLTARTKTTCAVVTCNGASKSGGGGVNSGAIAGPIVAVLFLLSLGVWWWLRRKKARDLARLEELEARARRAEKAQAETLSLANRSAGGSLHQRRPSAGGDGGHSPTFPEAALGDAPYEADTTGRTLRTYSSASINLDPSHPSNRSRAPAGDPFSDAASVATSNDGLSFLSQSTNVIPIAFIPSPSSAGRSISTTQPAHGGLPNRPTRAPELELGLNRGGQPQVATSSLGVPAQRADASSVSTHSASRASVAPSFSSFNSAAFALDTPTIATVSVGTAQRANFVQLGGSGKNRAPPSSYVSPMPAIPASASSSSGFEELASIPPNHHHTAKSIAGKSPLSQAVSSSPSQSPMASPVCEANDPFNDPSAARLSAQTATDEWRFSAGSLSAPSVLRQPSRPYSNASSFNGSDVVFSSANVVKVGEDNPLMRSGSITRLGKGKPQPPPISSPPAEEIPRASAPDRTSSGTAFSTADSLLQAYPFVPPSLSTMPNRFPSSSSNLASLPAAPLDPPSAVGGSRDTQLSLGGFDFLPPTSLPDVSWGQAGNSTERPEHGDRPTSLDMHKLSEDLRGFEHL